MGKETVKDSSQEINPDKRIFDIYYIKLIHDVQIANGSPATSSFLLRAKKQDAVQGATQLKVRRGGLQVVGGACRSQAGRNDYLASSCRTHIH